MYATIKKYKMRCQECRTETALIKLSFSGVSIDLCHDCALVTMSAIERTVRAAVKEQQDKEAVELASPPNGARDHSDCS